MDSDDRGNTAEDGNVHNSHLNHDALQHFTAAASEATDVRETVTILLAITMRWAQGWKTLLI